jgi:hypothetical protein
MKPKMRKAVSRDRDQVLWAFFEDLDLTEIQTNVNSRLLYSMHKVKPKGSYNRTN